MSAAARVPQSATVVNLAAQAAFSRAALAEAYPRISRTDLEQAKVRLETAMYLLRDSNDLLGRHATLAGKCAAARANTRDVLQLVVNLIEGRA